MSVEIHTPLLFEARAGFTLTFFFTVKLRLKVKINLYDRKLINNYKIKKNTVKKNVNTRPHFCQSQFAQKSRLTKGERLARCISINCRIYKIKFTFSNLKAFVIKYCIIETSQSQVSFEDL